MLARPPTPQTATIARLRMGPGILSCQFDERLEPFRLLIRSWGYTWNYSCWIRTDWQGTQSDRLAQLGRDLIAHGFIVEFPDNATMQAAISGAFKPEPNGRIMATADGRFKIRWRLGTDFYHETMRIPGARYNPPGIAVPSEHFEDILDFAQLHQFSISKKAQSLIDEMRQKLDIALVVDLSLVQPGTPAKPIEYEIADEFIDDPL